jgi:hypothetical protein
MTCHKAVLSVDSTILLMLNGAIIFSRLLDISHKGGETWVLPKVLKYGPAFQKGFGQFL